MLNGFFFNKLKSIGQLWRKLWAALPETHQWHDSASALPFLNTVFPTIAKFLGDGRRLALIYIDLTNFSLIEHMYGRSTCDSILKNVGQLLLGLTIDFFDYRQKIAVCTIGGDDFLIFIDAPVNNGHFEDEFVRFHQRLEEYLNNGNAELGLKHRLKVPLGYAEIIQRNDHRLESLVYSAIKQATIMAKGMDELSNHTRRVELERIIDERAIMMVYQPIVSLRSGQVFGLEALARGPVDSFFASPNNLFTYADKFDLLYQLDSLCREKAILSAKNIITREKLFLNISPQVVNDPNSQKGRTRQILQQAGFDAQNIVLELTERSAVIDYKNFRTAIEYYRKQGYFIAVDDVGAGYSNLPTVAELRPEYIKVDMSLLRGVNNNPAKKALLETFADFARRINAKIIAEGVETLEELKALLEIGFDFGQGYFFARPNENIVPINPEAVKMIHDTVRENKTALPLSYISIGELATYQKCISPGLTVRQATEIFNNNPHLYGLVVCDESKIYGLIMRPKLFCTLGTQYGYALFMHRLVSEILGPNPLIVPAEMPVSTVAQLVAGRTDETLEDYIIVTRNNVYQGVVSVRRLLESMASLVRPLRTLLSISITR